MSYLILYSPIGSKVLITLIQNLETLNPSIQCALQDNTKKTE